MNIDELVKKAQMAEPKRKSNDKYGAYFPVVEALLAKGFSFRAACVWLKDNEPALTKSYDTVYAALWKRFDSKKQKQKISVDGSRKCERVGATK